MTLSRLSPLAPVALLALLALLACSGAPPPPAPSPSSEAALAAPSASAATSAAPASASAPPTSTTAAPVATAAPSSEPARAPGPAPLSEAEQKEVEQTCKPLTLAMQKAKTPGKGVLDALADALKKPPASLKKAELARCSELLERGLRAYLTAAKEVEATVVMKQIGRAMASAYDPAKGTFCPATAHPVPADRALVDPGPYVSTASDWAAPTWTCLGLELTGQPQRFQYAVEVDAAGKSFVIIARGAPGGPGQWVEIRQRGRVGAKEIEMSPVERR